MDSHLVELQGLQGLKIKQQCPCLGSLVEIFPKGHMVVDL